MARSITSCTVAAGFLLAYGTSWHALRDRLALQAGETLTVDTGHVVAFEDSLKYSVSRIGGGWTTFLFGGEGLVCRFTGKGKVWLSTRNPVAFGAEGGHLAPGLEERLVEFGVALGSLKSGTQVDVAGRLGRLRMRRCCRKQ